MTPRQRAILFLALAGLAGMVASVLSYNWLQDLAKEAQHTGPTTKAVAVAATDLPWGITVTEDMANLTELPAGSVPEGAFTELAPLKGRVLLTAVKRHEPMLESKLAPASGAGGGLAAITAPGKRAMVVKVDGMTEIGLIKPRDRVDVLVTIRRPGESSEPVTKLVLENILVLPMIEGTPSRDADQKGERNKDKEDQTATAQAMSVDGMSKVISLEVTPEETEKLALAAAEGKVQLAVRNPLSTDTVLTKGVTIQSLLASYGGEEEKPKQPTSPSPPARLEPVTGPVVKAATKKPVPAGAPPLSVEVIKGMERTQVKF